MVNFKGYRTVAFGALVAIAPALLTYLGGVDWVSFGIHPALAAQIGAAIVGLRFLTDTSIGKVS